MTGQSQAYKLAGHARSFLLGASLFFVDEPFTHHTPSSLLIPSRHPPRHPSHLPSIYLTDSTSQSRSPLAVFSVAGV